MFIEVIQIANLVKQNEMKDIVANFVALLVLAQFDDYFVEIFLRSRMQTFLEKTLNCNQNFRSPKIVIRFRTDEEFEECGNQTLNETNALSEVNPT